MKTMVRRQFIKISSVSAAAVLTPLGAHASATLLTVEGEIFGHKPRRFTDEDLSGLQQSKFSTSIWTNTVAKFSGPTLKGLLYEVGAGPGSLRLRAVNDYMVDMPRARVEAAAPTIANRIDDEPYNIRHKGPPMHGSVGQDSSRESSAVTGMHEQTHTPDLQDQKLAGL